MEGLMRLGDRPYGPLAALVLLLLLGCDKPTTPTTAAPGSTTTDVDLQAADVDEAEVTSASIPFADAEVFFEFNTTDNDLGFQLFLDADGWKRVRLLDPGKREIALLQAEGKLAQLGITELRFESAEPSPEEVLAEFPPGVYRLRGQSVEGDYLVSNAILSHDFAPAPTMSPSNGQVVDPGNTVVEWNAPGAEFVELIIEQDELGHVLDITVSGSTKRMRVPPQFLKPGREYKIEILSISENGNRTIAESMFRTGS
jgi:hypothetical protein